MLISSAILIFGLVIGACLGLGTLFQDVPEHVEVSQVVVEQTEVVSDAPVQVLPTRTRVIPTPTVIPSNLPTLVLSATRTPMPTSTRVPSATRTPTPEIFYEPVVVEVNWGLSSFYGRDIMEDVTSLLVLAEQGGYDMTTFASMHLHSKPLILVFEGYDQRDASEVKDFWDYLVSKNVPIVFSIPANVLDDWPLEDVSYLHELLTYGWQIANGGSNNAGLVPGDDRVNVPYEIQNAHNVIKKLLGVDTNVLVFPRGYGYDNPQVYEVCADLSYVLAAGYFACDICGTDIVDYYDSVPIEEYVDYYDSVSIEEYIE